LQSGKASGQQVRASTTGPARRAFLAEIALRRGICTDVSATRHPEQQAAVMSTGQSVARHYAHGSLEQTILDALARAGKDLDSLSHVDLAPIDEFHIGGRRVTGIDLTEDHVRVANTLAQRVGLRDRVSYRKANATSLPFPDGGFDGACMIHVGMNIEDKARAFREVRRVVRPGGFFAIYDVMRDSDGGEPRFPAPWASTPATSFVATPAAYRRLLEAARFVVQAERDRRDFAIEFFRQLRARAGTGDGPPPLGLHILMGETAQQKVANMIDNLERALIAPREIFARAA
jgi:SAM-dependent methyltransferase